MDENFSIGSDQLKEIVKIIKKDQVTPGKVVAKGVEKIFSSKKKTSTLDAYRKDLEKLKKKEEEEQRLANIANYLNELKNEREDG